MKLRLYPRARERSGCGTVAGALDRRRPGGDGYHLRDVIPRDAGSGRAIVTDVTPFLVVSDVGNDLPSSPGGSFFIFAGFVRELCRYVPPVRSMVRVFSRFRGRI